MRSVRHILGSESLDPMYWRLHRKCDVFLDGFIFISGVFPDFFKAPGHRPQKAVPARPLVSPDSIRGFLAAGMLPPSRSAKRVTRPSQLMPVMASPKSSETSAMT